jgi:riboflavin synthase
MFTGIIEEIGTVESMELAGDNARLAVRGPLVSEGASHGSSISVSGVCLTVVDRTNATFTADVMAQTLATSTLADAAAGTRVNLERAALVGGRFGGHLVQGHVDGIAHVRAITEGSTWQVVRFSLALKLAPLVADKGSIAIDGASLTISAVSAPHENEAWFEVSLIPETLTATTLGALHVGDQVNVETDVLARHVQRLLAFDSCLTHRNANAVTTNQDPE